MITWSNHFRGKNYAVWSLRLHTPYVLPGLRPAKW